MIAGIADCHNDLLMSVKYLRERGHEDPFGDFWLPQFRAGGVRFQVLPVCTEEQYVGEGALRRALLMIEEAHHLARVHADDVAIVQTGAEMDEVLASGRIALLLAIEGAEPIGHSVEMLDTLYRVGIRMCSLSWNRRTMLADGVAEQDTGGRLTQLGVDAVRRMEHLGMIVDVSHLSEAGFWHLADVATRPFIASHSSCRALVDHPRNLTDEQLTLIADRGGFVGVNAFGPFLAEHKPSVTSYVDHLAHAMEVMGDDHVGLGADFIEDVTETVDPIFTGLLVDWRDIPQTADLRRPSDFVHLAQEAEARFGIERATAALSGNLLTFVRRALT